MDNNLIFDGNGSLDGIDGKKSDDVRNILKGELASDYVQMKQ